MAASRRVRSSIEVERPDDPLWVALHARLHAPLPRDTLSADVPSRIRIPTSVAFRTPRSRRYGDEHRERAKAEMAKKGMEAIAYYRPVHHFGPDRWGIYFVEPLFYGFCAEVARRARHVSWERVVTELWHAVDRHECFHAATELFALVAEDFMRTAFTEGPAAPHDAPEIGGWCAYGKSNAARNALEEIFATAAEFREPVTPPALRDALIEKTRLLPRPYAAGLAYVQHDGRFDHGLFAKALDRLARDLIHTVSARAGDKLPLARRWFPEVSPRALKAHGPIPRYAVS